MLVLIAKNEDTKRIFLLLGLTMNEKANINGDVVIKQFTMRHGWGGGGGDIDTYTLTCTLSLKITRRGIIIKNMMCHLY
jgi:hypothetical protein